MQLFQAGLEGCLLFLQLQVPSSCTVLAPTSMGITLVDYRGAGNAEAFGAEAATAEVLHKQLKDILSHPASRNLAEECRFHVYYRGAGDAEAFGAKAAAAEVGYKQLKEMLTYPASWGPTEWGPIPFLPEPDVLVSSMERQWGDLAAYRGIATSASGICLTRQQSFVSS